RNENPVRGCDVALDLSSGSLGSNVYTRKTVYRNNSGARRVGAGEFALALADGRPQSICLLPADRGDRFRSEDSTPRHRRHDVGELPVYFAGCDRTEPAGNDGSGLHRNTRTMPAWSAPEAGSDQGGI